jgi:hypothetical protein
MSVRCCQSRVATDGQLGIGLISKLVITLDLQRGKAWAAPVEGIDRPPSRTASHSACRRTSGECDFLQADRVTDARSVRGMARTGRCEGNPSCIIASTAARFVGLCLP